MNKRALDDLQGNVGYRIREAYRQKALALPNRETTPKIEALTLAYEKAEQRLEEAHKRRDEILAELTAEGAKREYKGGRQVFVLGPNPEAVQAITREYEAKRAEVDGLFLRLALSKSDPEVAKQIAALANEWNGEHTPLL